MRLLTENQWQWVESGHDNSVKSVLNAIVVHFTMILICLPILWQAFGSHLGYPSTAKIESYACINSWLLFLFYLVLCVVFWLVRINVFTNRENKTKIELVRRFRSTIYRPGLKGLKQRLKKDFSAPIDLLTVFAILQEWPIFGVITVILRFAVYTGVTQLTKSFIDFLATLSPREMEKLTNSKNIFILEDILKTSKIDWYASKIENRKDTTIYAYRVNGAPQSTFILSLDSNTALVNFEESHFQKLSDRTEFNLSNPHSLDKLNSKIADIAELRIEEAG